MTSTTADLVSMLQALQNPTSSIREPAEAHLNSYWLQRAPEELISGLAELMSTHGDNSVGSCQAVYVWICPLVCMLVGLSICLRSDLFIDLSVRWLPLHPYLCPPPQPLTHHLPVFDHRSKHSLPFYFANTP